jgi:prephenate dehydrogenase
MIGASLARDFKRLGLAEAVAGFGRSKERLMQVVKEGVLDDWAVEPEPICAGADLVVLATPVETFVTLARDVAPFLMPGALVIDVGSLKGAVVADVEALMPEGVHFVGCHPIAGSERSGAYASRAGLFEHARCMITPTERTDPGALARAEALWTALGCRVERMDAYEHDRVFGLVSHFAHMAAYAIVTTVGEADAGALRFPGAGFRDTTRIALSDPTLWSHICIMNRENLADALGRCMDVFGRMKDALEAGDSSQLEQIFERAVEFKRTSER